MRSILLVSVILIGIFTAYQCCAETLNIATLNYPPFQYEENGEIKGLAADIIKEVFQRMKQPIDIKFYPFPRAIQNIQTGVSDIIFTFYYKKEREEFAEYSKESLVDQTISLFVHKDSPIVFDGDLSKLNQYHFGLVRFSYGKIFDEAVKNKVITQIEYVSEMETNMKKFLKNRFDILPSDRWVAYYYYSITANSHENIGIKELRPPIETFPAFIGFSKAKPLGSIRDQVDKILREIKTDGTYQKIVDKHLKSWENIIK